MKPREMAPEPLVSGQVRPEREEDRNESAQAEDEREAESAADDEDREPGDREADDDPAEVHDPLEVVRVPREEVGGIRRVVLHLSELAPARARGVPDGWPESGIEASDAPERTSHQPEPRRARSSA